jgi:hypothetical protein
MISSDFALLFSTLGGVWAVTGVENAAENATDRRAECPADT